MARGHGEQEHGGQDCHGNPSRAQRTGRHDERARECQCHQGGHGEHPEDPPVREGTRHVGRDPGRRDGVPENGEEAEPEDGCKASRARRTGERAGREEEEAYGQWDWGQVSTF